MGIVVDGSSIAYNDTTVDYTRSTTSRALFGYGYNGNSNAYTSITNLINKTMKYK